MSRLVEAEGYMGQRIIFDGQTITVVKRKKEVRFRAADVRAIEWKNARKWWNGEIKFVVPGASDAPQTGSYWTRTGKDESYRYTVTFLVEQADTMRAVCDAIQRAGTGNLDQELITDEYPRERQRLLAQLAADMRAISSSRSRSGGRS